VVGLLGVAAGGIVCGGGCVGDSGLGWNRSS